tara:strand:+ start:6125 stop:6856 length:732 start_codon:yes stop_codon:yes gene_type:complete
MKTKKSDWSRREILSLGGKASIFFMYRPLLSSSTNYLYDVDHIIWAVSDLDEGIAYLQKKTSIRSIIGGVHPGRGTRNALISLGKHSYLEIISIDPRQPNIKSRFTEIIKNLTEPQVIGWAAKTLDIAAVEKSIRAANIEMTGPELGSRKKPDGRMLSWKTINVMGHDSIIVPFIIEWDKKSTHPSQDSPKGASLLTLQLGHPAPKKVNRFFNAMGLSIRAVKERKPKITAIIDSPKGQVVLS